jgi:hypothetical protein
MTNTPEASVVATLRARSGARSACTLADTTARPLSVVTRPRMISCRPLLCADRTAGATSTKKIEWSLIGSGRESVAQCGEAALCHRPSRRVAEQPVTVRPFHAL